jgi:glycosyltransferase involved in cell wall biosynthesis
MRILVLTNEFGRYILGGLGIVANQLTLSFAKCGNEVTVVTTRPGQQVRGYSKDGCQIIRFPLASSIYHSHQRNKFRYMPVIRWINRKMKANPDIIHVHSVPFANVAIYCKEKYNVPLVYTCHSLVAQEKSSSKKMTMERQEKLLKYADRVVVPSVWQAETLVRLYPYCEGKTFVIENGVSPGRSMHRTKERELLYVGRLIPLKGIEELLNAVAILARRRRSVRLHVVGSGPKNYTNRLKVLAHRLGLADKVTWHGYCPPDTMCKVYSSYGAVVMPSRRESFGLVALEALANRVPLISTTSGGLSEFVNEDVAQIIPKVEARTIASAVRRMWKDRESTMKRVEEGFKAAEQYSWEIIVSRYLELFGQLCAKEVGEHDEARMEAGEGVEG